MRMISIIVPVYNVEKYLLQCIGSILEQTYSDYEVILVDDGSSDSSGVICDQVAVNNPRFFVIHQENSGLSAARNVGVDHAHGEFLIFVDSDDMLVNDSLERLYISANKYNADMVCGRFIRKYDNSKFYSEKKVIKKGNLVYDSDKQKMSVFLDGKIIGTTAWAKLYRRELFENVRFPIGRYHEDVYTTYKLVDCSKRIVVIPEVVYIYRYNQESITNETFSEKKLDLIKGKTEQALYVGNKYPSLQNKAYAGIIYACNQCLVQISRSKYSNISVLEQMQFLYRKYGIFYLLSRASVKGKLFTIIAMISISLIIGKRK